LGRRWISVKQNLRFTNKLHTLLFQIENFQSIQLKQDVRINILTLSDRGFSYSQEAGHAPQIMQNVIKMQKNIADVLKSKYLANVLGDLPNKAAKSKKKKKETVRKDSDNSNKPN
jgi:hypothetical protein